MESSLDRGFGERLKIVLVDRLIKGVDADLYPHTGNEG